MRCVETELPGVTIVETQTHHDGRGFLREICSLRDLPEGLRCDYVQDNHSRSRAGVLRGFHYQLGAGQAKLVSVIRGRVLDVVVDVRWGSPGFGRSVAVELCEDDARMLFVAAGFAHGFYALAAADVVYKCSDYYRPEAQGGIIWNDPTIGAAWPAGEPILSARDAALPRLADLAPSQLPAYRG